MGLSEGDVEGEEVTGELFGEVPLIGDSVGNDGSSSSVGVRVGAWVLVHVPLVPVDQPGKHTQIHSSQSQTPLTQ